MNSDSPKPPLSKRTILFLLALVLIAASALNYWGLRDVKSAIAQQAELTRASNKTDRDALIAAQRAYLYATDTEVHTMPADGGERTEITPKWANVGDTPANPVVLEIRCPIIVEKKQEIPKEQMDTPAGQQLQAPDQPVTRLKALFTPKEVKTGGACIFTKDQLILLLPSKPHLYLTARAIYRDVFAGTPLHITEYCSDTVPVKGPDNKIIFQSNLCDKFNCTDDQCPAEERQEVEKEYGKM